MSEQSSGRSGWRWDAPRWLWPILDRLWKITLLWSITVDGSVTWWCSDDIHQRERKLDYELRVPRWPWRLYCWHRGHHDPDYRSCVFCEERCS